MLTKRFRWRDPVYGGVLVWACIGIVIARADTPLLAVTAGVLALVVAATLVPWRRRAGATTVPA